MEATFTIAKHGRSFQGYITASLGSWLHSYVENRLNKDVECEYLVQPVIDLILIPKDDSRVANRLEKLETRARNVVRRQLRREELGPPPDAVEIGLYFEILEAESLEHEYPPPNWRIQHRYPAIDSAVLLLRSNNISCDIDVTTGGGEIVRCVEVKSVSGAPRSSFNVSRREWNSREWCAEHQIPYDIVVYYHARFQVIERLVIPSDTTLKCEASGYWCTP
jgi:hypothetical protein